MKYDLEAMNFVRDATEAVLKGDTMRLIGAFVWDETPEGHDYWNNQWLDEAGLDDVANQKLSDMLAQSDFEVTTE